MSRNLFISLSLTAYTLLLAAGLFHHELWGDEAHHFLLGRDSQSFGDLLHNCRYEGHPLLWNLLIYILTRFTHDPLYMQALNLVLAVFNAYLILRYSPFPRHIQILLIFGYFSLFEYGVLSRNYMLGFALLSAYLALASIRSDRYWMKIILLLLLANTHLFGLVLALCLFVADLPPRLSSFPTPYRIGLPVFMAGLALTVWLALPPGDHMLVKEYNQAPLLSAERFKKIITIPVKAFLHIPEPGHPNLWNRSLLVMQYPGIAAILSLALAIIPGVLFRRSWRLLVLFFGPLLLIAVFSLASPLMMSPRHAGFVFLALLACWWKAYSDPHISLTIRKRISRVYTPLLIIQLACCLFMLKEDWQRPFSQGKQVAEYLEAHNPQVLPVAMSNQGSGQPISAYLGQPLYYPDKLGMGSFAAWNTIPFVLPADSAFARAHRLAQEQQRDIWLILNHYPPYTVPAYADSITAFTGAIVGSENYRLYKVSGE